MKTKMIKDSDGYYHVEITEVKEDGSTHVTHLQRNKDRIHAACAGLKHLTGRMKAILTADKTLYVGEEAEDDK